MMKAFKSLNCGLCRLPFVPIANQPQSPRHLNCGKPICHKCFEEEKQLKKEERKHKCREKDCFSNPNFAYSLIESNCGNSLDILSSNSLVHVPIRAAYLLTENFVLPECPVCHEEFTVDGEKQPYFLNCLHDLCKECFEKCRKPNECEKKDEMLYTVTCPKCKAITRTNYPYSDEQQVLAVFPALVPRRLTRYNCADCQALHYDTDMYHCGKCQRNVCAQCVSKISQDVSRIPCSKCNLVTSDNENYLNKQLSNFLKELPEMTRQLEEMKSSPFRFCDACKSLDSIERMFHCSPCNQKLCGTCVLQKHHSGSEHETVGLLQEEAMQFSDALQQTSINLVEAYQFMFPPFHQMIDDKIQDFRKKLIAKEERLKQKLTFEAFQKSFDSCKRLKSDFESTAEEYLPNLRKCDARLEDLIKNLEEDSD